MLTTCPKCDLPDVAADDCPRCGVATSRYRAYLESLGPASLPDASTVVLPTARPAAGFWRRAAAVVIDFVVVLIAGRAFRGLAGLLWADAVTSSRVLTASDRAFEMVFGPYYWVLLHWLWGQTLGKMAMGIRVVRLSGEPLTLGRVILRLLGYCVSEVTLGFGFLLAALRSDRRALHDLIAGTRVERVEGDGEG